MKRYIGAIMLGLALSACQSQATEAPPLSAPATEAKDAPPAFPVTINGPGGEQLLRIDADGFVTGDPQRVTELLKQQKGGLPQENILMALLMRAAIEDDAKARIANTHASSRPAAASAQH